MSIDTHKSKSTIDNLCINTIKTLTMDAVEQANSGHPGTPMGLAAAGHVLWNKILKHNPKNPDWQNRDRFVLSCGHASMLLYSLLYLTGYDLNLNDIKKFRQLNSKTPGHPEYQNTNGVETTTGPLGQGLANAVGFAMAEAHMAARFNKPGYEIVDHFTYVFCGDGDLMEGISSEAASIAGHLSLSKLICIYDSNNITIEGNTNITFSEDIATRFKSYNWHVLTIENGNNLNDIYESLKTAQKKTNKPSIIILKTHIADGSPNMKDRASAHGSPFGKNEVKLTKKELSWPEDETFLVPNEVISFYKECSKKGTNSEYLWLELYKNYTKKFPKLANELVNALTHFMPTDWNSLIPNFKESDPMLATRTASGKILNAIANKVPNLVGGSADLAPSNKTFINNAKEFKKKSYIGKNIHFGVREFAMNAIMSGMFLHGGIRPYGGTFLVFSDYMRPAIRMASLMKLPLIYIFTHDSIAVGEDGPTHQPVEHLAALRAIPRLNVIRPADANETVEAWQLAMLSNDRPIALILSRQKLPILDKRKTSSGVKRGAYILSDCHGKPELLIIATGSEIHIALEAKKTLKNHKIRTRIISMPCWEIFEKQSNNYKKKILPPEIKNRIAIEAGIMMGWERYINDLGIFVGVNDFGVSAPGSLVMKKFGLTVDNIVKKAIKLCKNRS